ncbi:hypothetical protein C0585_04100 [Candidatus Woesearchaeota archaeon]|nr:MAG: hypothetical protein C0585_04100 [Candidatus Woesearchaeota archaeon]
MKWEKNWIRGTQFEIWLEGLLSGMNISNLERNVEFYQGEKIHRQIDLCYEISTKKGTELVLVEAKYSMNGPITYELRDRKKKKQFDGRRSNPVYFDNLVDEIVERQDFVGGDYTCLVTNNRFEDKLKVKAEKAGIDIIDGKKLEEICNKDRRTIDKEIRSIKVKDYSIDPITKYLR